MRVIYKTSTVRCRAQLRKVSITSSIWWTRMHPTSATPTMTARNRKGPKIKASRSLHRVAKLKHMNGISHPATQSRSNKTMEWIKAWTVTLKTLLTRRKMARQIVFSSVLIQITNCQMSSSILKTKRISNCIRNNFQAIQTLLRMAVGMHRSSHYRISALKDCNSSLHTSKLTQKCTWWVSLDMANLGSCRSREVRMLQQC